MPTSVLRSTVSLIGLLSESRQIHGPGGESRTDSVRFLCFYLVAQDAVDLKEIKAGPPSKEVRDSR